MERDTPERVVCAVLRQEVRVWDGSADKAASERFLAAAHYHGALPLLDAAFHAHKEFESWPPEILVTCRKAARSQAMYELAHRAELTRVLDALSLAGVVPLVLK